MLHITESGRLDDFEGGAGRGLGDLDARGEGLFDLVDVGDDDNLLEVVLYRLDGLGKALLSGGVEGAEALVDEQDREGGAGPAGEQLREGYPEGEIDTEGLASAECLVAPGTDLVGYLDVQLL